MCGSARNNLDLQGGDLADWIAVGSAMVKGKDSIEQSKSLIVATILGPVNFAGRARYPSVACGISTFSDVLGIEFVQATAR
jgi:hypothetical protein